MGDEISKKKNQSRKELKIKEIAITKMRIKFNKKN
jgi:hypothetical protein